MGYYFDIHLRESNKLPMATYQNTPLTLCLFSNNDSNNLSCCFGLVFNDRMG